MVEVAWGEIVVAEFKQRRAASYVEEKATPATFYVLCSHLWI